MTTLEVLRAAYRLLDDREKWTTGALARRADGGLVGERDKAAICWCGLGALYYVATRAETASIHLAGACNDLYGRSVPAVNDGPDGYRRIRAAFRRAIRQLEREEGTA